MNHGHQFDMALSEERNREIKTRQERLAARKGLEAAAPDLLKALQDLSATYLDSLIDGRGCNCQRCFDASEHAQKILKGLA